MIFKKPHEKRRPFWEIARATPYEGGLELSPISDVSQILSVREDEHSVKI
jgi:hypothetical protein